ncbi:MAG: hypothetical protein BGO38_11180 [Cellulomonas sp. 73-145]|uniref:nuclear transport factor 2 family protein n=1 Tax=Cellulomonas sp. 73-145 TaxID=1895739 RepID=UPI0009260AED|nr:nuclear transport factor 2 family protein [Cellulomonas sp. 73-145]OJV56723.1 MAG: hypothetical protein BGO38_11180 [Cellulomonas sp. 73-145]
MSSDTSKLSAAEGVRAAYDRQREAMVRGDTAELDTLLGERFTLTHMTGYLQPKTDWLDDISSHQMQYHSIRDVDVDIEHSQPDVVLVARTLTDATIWGSRGTWRLQLRIEYTLDGDDWIAARTIASTW